MQTFYEKEQSNWYPSHALVLRITMSMTVLCFNRVCQLDLAWNGSEHITLKEYMNLLVKKLSVIVHEIVPQTFLRDKNTEEIQCR